MNEGVTSAARGCITVTKANLKPPAWIALALGTVDNLAWDRRVALRRLINGKRDDSRG